VKRESTMACTHRCRGYLEAKKKKITHQKNYEKGRGPPNEDENSG